MIRRLADARLLVTSRDPSAGKEAVEVSHEALIDSWGRLRDWLKADRDFLNARNRLQFSARQWEQDGRSADRLLQPGLPLKEGRHLLDTRRSDLGSAIVAYIKASLRAHRRRRTLRGFWVGIAIFPLLMGGAFLAWADRHGLAPAAAITVLGIRAGLAPAPPEPEMVPIRPGRDRFPASFTMGSVVGIETERPPHEVTLAHPFAIGKFEVTFTQYDAFAKATKRLVPNGSGWGREGRPVINVSWDDARDYAKWLSLVTGKSYHLPTEAEWEYAARAGTTTDYWWGNKIREGGRVWANCSGCGSEEVGQKTAPVDSFPANGFGLHDTAGNVWEWVEDCWHESYEGASRSDDGKAWLEADGGDCGRRVIRGGSWHNEPMRVRSAYRGGGLRGTPYVDVGFRLAQDL